MDIEKYLINKEKNKMEENNNKERLCPYCRSKNTIIWEVIWEKTLKYKCNDCGKYFEIKDIDGSGEQVFQNMGDNHPVFPEQNSKLNRGDKVLIKIDTGVVYKGEIIYSYHDENKYKVKYKQGHEYVEETVTREQLELEITGDENKSIKKDNFSHEKFKNMGVVPKKNKDNLANLWLDLWEHLK